MCDVNGLRIIPSYKCNYNCSFCYQKDHSLDLSQKLNISTLANRITTLRNSGFKPMYITFMGGEFTILENSLEYIDLINKYFPFSQKSLTTNGSASFEYYDSLKMHGVNHITFSMNGSDEYMIDKIYQLKISGSFILRVNIYFNINNPQRMEDILTFCMNTGIQATFCVDIKSSDIPTQDDILKILGLNPSVWIVDKYANHMIFKSDEFSYSFWVFHHKQNYKNDNYIIIPSGEMTCNFKHVIDCRGAKKGN